MNEQPRDTQQPEFRTRRYGRRLAKRYGPFTLTGWIWIAAVLVGIAWLWFGIPFIADVLNSVFR